MSIELKPCPFCGKTSEVRVVAASDMWDSEGNGPFPHEESYAVICDASTENDCRGCGGASGYFSSERQAILAWNTRSDAAAQAEIARLRGRVAELEAALSGMVEFFQPHAWGSGDNRADALREARKALGAE